MLIKYCQKTSCHFICAYHFVKRMCIANTGVKPWNSLDNSPTSCKNVHPFKTYGLIIMLLGTILLHMLLCSIR